MSEDYQPTATGPSAPAGHAWDARGDFGAGYEAWNGADDNASTYWGDTIADSPWWRYIPPVSVRFIGCSIKIFTVVNSAPKSFTVQGWDGGQWVILLTVANEPAWGSGEKRSFDFLDNEASYSEYRIHFTAVYLGSNLAIAEFEWFEAEEVGERSSMVVMV